MHLSVSVHMARRAAARLGAALLLALVSSVPSTASDEIAITGGSLVMNPGAGPIVLRGDRGFSLDGGVAAAGGIFTPYFYCNLLDGPCSPGDTVSLLGLWSGTDAPARFTLEGVTYTSANMTATQLAFSGSFRLPALSTSATVTAPFHFKGGVSYVPDITGWGAKLSLSGSGVTTISLVPHQIDGVNTGRWRILEVRYEFGARVPAPFVAADIGDVGTPGTSSFLADHFVVNGAGADIWGTTDAFRFVHQSLSGTGSVVAQVVSMQNTHAFAKAGVMLRDSLAPSAAMALLSVKPDGGLEFMVRYAEGEPVLFITGPPAVSPAVFLRLARGAVNEVRAAQSADGLRWTEVGSAVVPFLSTEVVAGLAVTSHDRTAVNSAMFDHVGVRGGASANLLVEGDFEGYSPPALGLPGWVSDDQLRQIAAKSETHQPRSGAKNGACWTTTFLDCGMFQEVTAPATGTYTLRIHASADRPGGLVGANVSESTAVLREVAVAPFGVYAPYTMTFTATAGAVIRVWMYSPAQPGYVVIDDASLTLAPGDARLITQGTWTIQATGGPFGAFDLRGADFYADGTYEWGEVDALTACRTSCAPGTVVALRSMFVNQTPTDLMSFARGTTSLGATASGWVEYAGALTLSGGMVTLPAVTGTEWPQPVKVVAPFVMDGVLEGYDVVGVREPKLLFREPMRGSGSATLELLAHPDASGHTVLTFYRLTYEFS